MRGIGVQLRDYRLDTGASQAAIARAAGVSPSHLSRIEGGLVEPSLESLVAVARALGGDLSLRFRPGTGPNVRDHLQATMVRDLLRVLHPRWRRLLEVPVYRPVVGSIDLVLIDEPQGVVVAAELQSLLNRVEQQLRWSRTKAEQLPATLAFASTAATVSQLLVLRNCEQTRAVASEYGEVLATAFPARAHDAVRALTSAAPWPGNAIVWMSIDGGAARLLQQPPRFVALGR